MTSWKHLRKRKSRNEADLDNFVADFNYKNIQLPSLNSRHSETDGPSSTPLTLEPMTSDNDNDKQQNNNEVNITNALPNDIIDKLTAFLGGNKLPNSVLDALAEYDPNSSTSLPPHIIQQIKDSDGVLSPEKLKEFLALLPKSIEKKEREKEEGKKDDADEIKEWENPAIGGLIQHVPIKEKEHPTLWAFKRLLNRMIDQLNWFLKYIYDAKDAANKPEPDAMTVLFAFLMTIIILVIQLVFFIPNLISYITEFIGICFATLLFEIIAPKTEPDKYKQGILASIEGANGITGTIVALLVTLNLWHTIYLRESDTDVVSILESMLSKPLFGFFKHGIAGPIALNYLFGRMKMGKPLQEPEPELNGAASMNPMAMLSGLSGASIGQMASVATAKMVEGLVFKIKNYPSICFMILFVLIYSSFMGGAFNKLLNSQNVIKSMMKGEGGGNSLWYIITIFCIIATAVSFLSALPGSFNQMAPLLSLFYILMLLIATLVTFQLGAVISVMIMFYFMFLVLPLEEFGNIFSSVDIIFASFKIKPEPEPNENIMKKLLLRYGVVILFIFAILGSFIKMMTDVGKSLPAEPKFTGGIVGYGFLGLVATLFIIYKYVFPNNIREIIDLFTPPDSL